MKIFVSHAVSDGAAKAAELVELLEAIGDPCWIAPRDIAPGRTYPAQIMAAIRESRAVILLLTEAANRSPDVLQEVQIAHSAKKLIVPASVGTVPLSDDLGYFLSVRQHLRWSTAGEVVAAIARVLPPLAPVAPTAAMDAITAVAAAAASESGISGRFGFVVRSAADDGEILWLCSEIDYRDPRCLSVAVRGAARHRMKGADQFRGRRITVEGVALKKRIDFLTNGEPTGLYYYQTHVDVDDPAQVTSVD